MIKIDAKLVKEMVAQSLDMLNSGDIVIFKDVMYFDKHADASREIAEPLYAIFKRWAMEREVPLTYKNFYRVYFSALGHMNAHKQTLRVSVVVNRNDMGVYVMYNKRQNLAN